MLGAFESSKIIQIPREKNSHADALASLDLASGFVTKNAISFAYLDEPSIESAKPKETVKNMEESSRED